jgi:glycine hydroxymethyltransferase
MTNSESVAFRSGLDVIRSVEPRVAAAIGQELADQRESLKRAARRDGAV